MTMHDIHESMLRQMALDAEYFHKHKLTQRVAGLNVARKRRLARELQRREAQCEELARLKKDR